jgi:hypothetical protein
VESKNLETAELRSDARAPDMRGVVYLIEKPKTQSFALRQPLVPKAPWSAAA